jgi:pimeloyl-ACP methyl ester carboxylesterase
MENQIDRGFVRIEEGQVHFRRVGDPASGRPLVLVHASPSSSLNLVPLIQELAGTRPLLAPDTLGHGDSACAAMEVPDIVYYAGALGRVLDTLGVGEIDIYGTHTGASIASEFAIAQPERVHRLVIDGIGLFTAEEQADLLANYAPAMQPDDLGSQLNWAWHFVRDQAVFFPWYRRDAEHRGAGDMPPPEVLHGIVVEVLKAITTYHHAYRAAFSHNKRERLPLVSVPALVMGETSDPLSPTQDEVCALLPAGELADLSNTPDGVTAAKAAAIIECIDRD